VADLGIPNTKNSKIKVRDLWGHKDVDNILSKDGTLTVDNIPGHGNIALRFSFE
jgi:hypothetical protein